MRWTLKPEPEKETIHQLSKELGIDKTLSSLLIHRGIACFDDAKKFFRPTLNDIHDPFC